MSLQEMLLRDSGASREDFFYWSDTIARNDLRKLVFRLVVALTTID